MVDLQDVQMYFGPDNDREIDLKRQLAELQERYRQEAQPILDALAQEHARKAPRMFISFFRS